MKIECGYIRDRNDGMSEYTIVGFPPVKSLLNKLMPYLKLKRKQAELTLNVLARMLKNGREMCAELLFELSREVDKFKDLNYSKKRKITAKSVHDFLVKNNLFDPVETDS